MNTGAALEKNLACMTASNDVIIFPHVHFSKRKTFNVFQIDQGTLEEKMAHNICIRRSRQGNHMYQEVDKIVTVIRPHPNYIDRAHHRSGFDHVVLVAENKSKPGKNT